ncbi:MAG: ROK family protein [Planctomycetes bacterium]|nr:ROK family protein [Planctomycetota bacterium]
MTTRSAPATAKPSADGPCTLAIDVGGTGLKGSVLSSKGEMLTERVRIETPQPCNPTLLVDTLAKLVEPLPKFDRVSVGFPGVIREGKIITAPNLGTEKFRGFDLGAALEKKWGKPVRALNDADMQGFAAIKGQGVEMVITLGTGFGTALFQNGQLAPHLEIAHQPFRKGESYDQQLGNAALEKVGKKKWTKRVKEAIRNLRVLVNFDRLHIGGGNAKKLAMELSPDMELVDNTAGILGGVKLWGK